MVYSSLSMDESTLILVSDSIHLLYSPIWGIKLNIVKCYISDVSIYSTD